MTERSRYQFDVFISYSTKQEEQASALFQRLISNNLKTFYANESLKQDELTPNQFVHRLEEALCQSCQAVVLLSESFLNSSWCVLEMRGFFGLVIRNRNRKLWIVTIEDVDHKLIGQLVPFIYKRGLEEIVTDIRRAANIGLIKVGDKFSEHKSLKIFQKLPLREFYEPPDPRNRPPWSKDDRSPLGVRGAPPYGTYERLVREYMVQIDRGRDPEFDIPMLPMYESHSYIPERAKKDADRLSNLDISPYNSPGERSLWETLQDYRKARAQGKDPLLMDCLEGKAIANAGELDQGIQLMKRGIEAAKEDISSYKHFIYELAKAEHLKHRFEEALAILDKLEGTLPPKASLVRSASLARLGRLSVEEKKENRTSDIHINDIRIESSIKHRKDLDFWAESLELAGFRL